MTTDASRAREISILIFALIAQLSNASPAAGQSQPALGKSPPFQRALAPLIKKYCHECHKGEKARGGVQLDRHGSRQEVLSARETWEGVLEMVKAGLMPPEDKPQPSAIEREQIVKWLDVALFFVDCQKQHDPGRVTIRRLNRNEYDNTLRDLLDLDLKLAADFPSDDVGEGFDNIGDVLSLPPLLLEKYMDAAEKAAAAAIALPSNKSRLRVRRQLIPRGAAKLDGDVYSMYSRGSVTGSFRLAREGDYLLRVVAAADQAGPELAKMEIRVAGKVVGALEVKGNRNQSRPYELKVKAPKGEKVMISAEFINDYYQPDAKDPKLRGDRNLYVRSLEVIGPVDFRAEDAPANHRKLIVSRPDDKTTWEQASSQVLEAFMTRAFRRPLEAGEVEPYVSLVLLAKERGESFESAMRVAVSAVLVSPRFLFRIERDPAPDDPNQIRELNDFELATRLSYFLWSSMPDEQLFEAARKGRLRDDRELQSQVRRMLKDERSHALVKNFGGQWLNLRNLDEIQPDPNLFKGFDAKLRESMKEETLRFFTEIMREDRSIMDFIDGPFTFVNERLAKHYGIDDVKGEQFQRVKLDPQRRAGVLTQASILTLTSNPTRTSAVKRGKWILENILGEPPPEPPANVPELAATQKAKPNASLREQLVVHRKNPTCAICHVKMDELGFGFENFDAIGRWRDKDRERAIDASGELPGGVKFSGPGELVPILRKSEAQFSRVMAKKMLTYALGRGIEYYDRCTVDDIVKRLETNQHRFSALVTGIVLSDAFRKRRGDGGKR